MHIKYLETESYEDQVRKLEKKYCSSRVVILNYEDLIFKKLLVLFSD